MASAAMLDFYIFEFLIVRTVKRTKLRHHAIFRGEWANRSRNMAIFSTFLGVLGAK